MGTKHGTHRDFTLDEHLKLAEEISLALRHLKKAYEMCQKCLGKSNGITKSLHNLIYSWGLSGGSKVIKRFKEELHSKYNALVDDETYRKHGEIYHDLRRDKKASCKKVHNG